jgi:outer membrane protein
MPQPPASGTSRDPSGPCAVARRLALLAGMAAGFCWGVLAGGCASPLHDSNDLALRRSIAQAAGRELVEAQRNPDIIALRREPRIGALHIDARVLPELEQMAGPASYIGVEPPLGDPLLPGEQRVANITLERAIRSAVEHNLNVQFARLAPAISEARLVAAQAAFDWVFFASTQWESTDDVSPNTSAFSPTTPPIFSERQTVSTAAGFRRRLTTGGQFAIQHAFSYTDFGSGTVVPDPAYQPTITLRLDQPLLRNFGSDAALAQVRLARNAERDDIQELKSELIQTITDVEEAYWNLARAQADLKILNRLLESGTEVRDRLYNRMLTAQDVRPVQFSDAVARVEDRRGQVMRAQNALRQASTRLKLLINDPEFPVGSEVMVLASDDAIDAPIQFSLADAFMLALANRPEVYRSLLSIDDTSIRLRLADNARLPLLDLRAETRFSGLGDDTADGYQSLFEENFVSFLIGLNFETPIGNREAEARYQERRLEQMQSVIAYRNTIQNIALEVKRALYDLVTNYTLIEQTRAARVAAAESLRTLLVEEDLLVGLTAEFLDLKLRRQEALALAEQNEVDALVQYNISLARLYAAMGTTLQRNRIQFDAPDNPQLAPTSPLYPANNLFP